MSGNPMAESDPARRGLIPKLTRTELVAASVIIVLGLIFRMRLALITYLNPDEASHVLSSFGSWSEMFTYAYRVDKHPPLLLYMTHLVLFISRSELAVRLIPVLSGSLFPIFLCLWLRRVAGKFAGMSALFLLTLSPHFVIISAQLRSYTLAFLFLSASLIAFEIAMDSGGLRPMLAFDLFLLLGVSSDYSMAFFAGPVGIYALMRLRQARFPIRIAWAAGQVLPLAACIVQFFSNRHFLPKSWGAWLSAGFPRPTAGLWFPVVNTAQQFGYAMGSLPLGIVAWVMFSAGVFLLWTGRTPVPRDKARALATLLTLPFLLGIIAACAGVYPYGATRHSLVIGVFAAAGVAVFLEFAPRPSRTVIAWAAVVPLLIWVFIPNRDRLDIPPWRNRKSQMLECFGYIRAKIPPDAPILADRETLQMLMYYDGSRRPPSRRGKWFIETPLAGRWRIAVRDYEYNSQKQFQTALAAFRAQYGIGASQPVWVLDGGFSVDAGPADEKLPFTQAIRVFHIP